jgi:hypothetical protein
MNQQNEYPLWRLWENGLDGTSIETPKRFGESSVEVTKLSGIEKPIYSTEPEDKIVWVAEYDGKVISVDKELEHFFC